MTEVLDSLRRYMPQWMATRGAALLDALPEAVERWVEPLAGQVDAMSGPPERDRWDAAIEARFGDGRTAQERARLVDTIRAAILLVAIQRMPAPVITAESERVAPTDTKTKELDRVGIKRTRILGMLETSLHAHDAAAEALVASLKA